MLKKYIAPSKLRLVGKAWEIRHALRQEKKLRNGGDIPLMDLLSFVQYGPSTRIHK